MRRWGVMVVAGACGVLVGAISSVGGGAPAKKTAPPLLGTTSPGKVAATPKQPVPGFADLHTHHMGHMNFGGEWMTGLPSGPPATALAACDKNVLHALPGALGRKSHATTVQGFPSFRDWPSWDNISHQSIYADWLKKAHEQGLSIMVSSMTNFEPLCRVLKMLRLKQDMIDACKDMTVVRAQIEEARRFEAANASWFKIVTDPAQAREAIAQGKLAVLLGIEVSNLFPPEFGTWQEQLDQFHALGVRVIQPVHELDNRFGRAATHDGTFKFLNNIKSNKNLGVDMNWLENLVQTTPAADGLTDEGALLIQALVDKKMLIDVAHLDPEGIREVYDILVRNQYYPMHNSHTYLWSVMTDEQKEKTKHIKAGIVQKIKNVGGMLGLRTGPEETVGYLPGHVANTCHGSSRSFAQTYGLATLGYQINVGFGSDLNGMIEATGPRFASGEDSCSWAYKHCGGLLSLGKLVGSCDAYKDERAAQQALQGTAAANGVGTDWDTKGMARIDGLDDLKADLRKLGLDTTPLDTSANAFVLMWERQFDGSRGPVDDSITVKTGACGTPQSDFACEMSKSERNDWAKAQSRACSTDAECGAGMYCDGGKKGTCKRKLDDGTLCTKAVQCTSNTCQVRCISPASKAMGEACYVNDECRVGKCSAALFGTVNGKCVCASNGDCASTQYCYLGFADIGTNECRSKLANYAACTSAGQCQGGACALRCYTPNSRGMGQSCEFNAECSQGTCSAELYGLVNGTCVCNTDAQCGANSYCDLGLAANIGKNECKAVHPICTSCSDSKQCGTGNTCHYLQCIRAGALAMGASCCQNDQCVTGQCEGGNCVCDKDSDCPGNQQCKKGTLGTAVNHCE